MYGDPFCFQLPVANASTMLTKVEKSPLLRFGAFYFPEIVNQGLMYLQKREEEEMVFNALYLVLHKLISTT